MMVLMIAMGWQVRDLPLRISEGPLRGRGQLGAEQGKEREAEEQRGIRRMTIKRKLEVDLRKEMDWCSREENGRWSVGSG